MHPISDTLLVSISKCFSYLVSSPLGQIFPPSSFYPLLSNCHNNESKTQVWPRDISPFIPPRWALVAYKVCDPQQSKRGLLWGGSLPHCRLISCSPYSMSRLEPLVQCASPGFCAWVDTCCSSCLVSPFLYWTQSPHMDSTGGPMVKNLPCKIQRKQKQTNEKNLPCNAGNEGSICGWGTQIPPALCTTTRESLQHSKSPDAVKILSPAIKTWGS